MGIHSSKNKQTGAPARVVKTAEKQTLGQSVYSLTAGAALEAGTTVATSVTNITDAIGGINHRSRCTDTAAKARRFPIAIDFDLV